jgi:hypothetical protein
MGRFPLLEKLIAAFRSAEGFQPYTYVCSAYPPSVLAGAWDQPALTRSLRHWVDGTSTEVRVHGNQRTKWHREIVRAVTRAGYTRRPGRDETSCRRWVRGRRRCEAELAFLATLGEGASPDRWRTRATTEPTWTEQFSARGWAAAIQAARSSSIRWNDAAVGFERRGSSMSAANYSVLVAVLGVEGPSRRIEIYVSIYDAAKSALSVQDQDMEAVRRELRSAGYSTGPAFAPLYGLKEVPTPSAAVRDSARIFASLAKRNR